MRKLILLMTIVIFSTSFFYAQENKKDKTAVQTQKNIKKESIKELSLEVSMPCPRSEAMLKQRLVSEKGVKEVVTDFKAKKVLIVYDSSITTPEILKNVAKSGCSSSTNKKGCGENNKNKSSGAKITLIEKNN